MSTTDLDITVPETEGAIARRAVIDRPAMELYAILADPRQHRIVDGSDTVGKIVVGDAPLLTGSTFTAKMTQLGVPYRITSTVTAATQGKAIEWRHPLGHRWRWELAERGDGSTEVTHSFVYWTTPLGQILKLAFGKANGEAMESSLRNLAAATV